MKFVEASLDVVKRPYTSNLRALIDEFLKTGYTVAEMDWRNYKDTHSCANAINSAAKNQARKSQVKAIVRKDHVYLINVIKYNRETEEAEK